MAGDELQLSPRICTMDLSNVHDKRQSCVKEQEQAPFEIIALNDRLARATGQQQRAGIRKCLEPSLLAVIALCIS